LKVSAINSFSEELTVVVVVIFIASTSCSLQRACISPPAPQSDPNRQPYNHITTLEEAVTTNSHTASLLPLLNSSHTTTAAYIIYLTVIAHQQANH
jgi:hypothetical protein